MSSGSMEHTVFCIDVVERYFHVTSRDIKEIPN